MSLNIIRWEEGKKPEILLAISNIKSYKITTKENNSLFDIIIYTREEDDNGLPIIPHYDTLIFNGKIYSVKNIDNSNIFLSSFDTLELIDKIERYLSSRVLLEYTYQRALKLYKSGKKEEATKILLEKIGPKPWNVDEMNVCIFNDLGYFLEEGKEYHKAIEVLEMVVSKFPERVLLGLILEMLKWD